jgi:serine/threonine-protein kinase PknG
MTGKMAAPDGSTMARCNRPDCGLGDIDRQGFCGECSRRPLPQTAPRADDQGDPATPGRVRPPAPAPEAARVRPEPWWGLDLVTARIAPAAPPEPEPASTAVTEEQRFCANPPCGGPVGRSRDGRPGRIRGYCPKCGQRFDFTRTFPGGIVADRYEVRGRIGSGGSGTALLAYDRSLGTDVVLKDLSASVAATARAERDALVGLRHESIVRIYGYENSADWRYLVLEYVPGTPLSKPVGDPLEVILAHGLRILQALDYLHARGLLHMDVKPSNVVRFAEQSVDQAREQVRLIDFGSVRKLGDTAPVESYTREYAPAREDGRVDLEYAAPTAGFDLFCLGTTLRELCGRYLSHPGSRSLNMLLDRATDPFMPRRFVSASQFAEQLSGVIRQVLAAAPDGRRIIRTSALFESMSDPLHGGLGAQRPLSDWTDASIAADGRLVMAPPFHVPAPAEVVTALPTPLADPDDPALTFSGRSPLAACRAALRNSDPGTADRYLRETDLPEWSWLRAWYAGLIALAGADAPIAAERAHAAAGHFQLVREALPGELIPEVALALCAEIAGDLPKACDYYRAVVCTAPALGVAGFGLARTLLLNGQRAEAVAAAQRLATEFQAQSLSFEREARIAVIRLRAAVTDSSVPTTMDLAQARKLAEEVGETAGPPILLNAEIQYAEFAADGGWLPMSDKFRELAKLVGTRQEFAGTQKEQYALVDLANRLRPPVAWRPVGFWKPRDRRISGAYHN